MVSATPLPFMLDLILNKRNIKDIEFFNLEPKDDYRLVWAKKVSLAAIRLVAGSASFGIRIN
jgi:hypothetical protein